MGGNSQSLPADYRGYEIRAEDIECVVGKAGELGSGGFAKVRLGFYAARGAVALKCFRLSGGTAEQYLGSKNCKVEMELLRKANHPNVVQVYGWAAWTDSIALAMEYLPGGKLSTRLLDADNKITSPLRLRFAAEIADAISFLHTLTKSKRMTHSDIKPDNVLLTIDFHCKLADFGGAQFCSYTVQARQPNEVDSDRLQYTPIYAAPELFENAGGKPTRSADVYSYGLTVYMILTGKDPTETFSSLEEYVQAIRRGQRPDTSFIPEKRRSMTTRQALAIADALESVMRQCWDHIPEERPEIIAVRNQLQKLLRKIKQADITKCVSEELERLNIQLPSHEEHKCAPLNQLDPITNTFAQDGQRTGQHQALSKKEKISKVKISLIKVVTTSDTSTLPKELKAVPQLVDSSKIHLGKHEHEKAKALAAELGQLLQTHADLSPNEIRKYGEQLQENELHLESIVFLTAAAGLAAKLEGEEEKIKEMEQCGAGMMTTCTSMVVQNSDTKRIVKDHVIPLMRDNLSQITREAPARATTDCPEVTCARQYISMCERLVSPWTEHELKLRADITRLNDSHGDDGGKQQIYGYLLSNLAGVCSRTSRGKEAMSLYEQAIDAYKSATDYDGDEQRRRTDIEECEQKLQAIKEKLT